MSARERRATSAGSHHIPLEVDPPTRHSEFRRLAPVVSMQAPPDEFLDLRGQLPRDEVLKRPPFPAVLGLILYGELPETIGVTQEMQERSAWNLGLDGDRQFPQLDPSDPRRRPELYTLDKFQNGVVTLTAIWPACGRRRRRLCNGRHLPPLSHRVAAELAECSAGDQMALDVEEVVDGRMDGEEPLRGRGRFEPLHLSLSSSHRLM